MRRLFFGGTILLLALAAPLRAQDFGFGFDGGEESAASSGGAGFGGLPGGGAIGAAINGEVSASMIGYADDFSDGLGRVKLGDIFSGRLSFSATASVAEGFVSLKLAPGPVYYDGKSPVYADEAYVRAYFGNFDVEAGLRKLTWGKADSFGPLDVINPLDT
ncbi:MAG: hypothetical protein LBH15_08435, partial [Treponema sp.]|nr:hypothetical protein [Treponema sp.]